MSYVNKGSMMPTVLVTSEPNRAGNFVSNGTSDEVEINAALAFLTSGRTWKEKVVLRGDFTLSGSIIVSSYTILDMRGATLTLANGVDDSVIRTAVTETEIEFIGGIIDGNKAGQTGGTPALWFRAVTRGLIEDVYVYDSYDRGISVDEGEYVLVHNVIVVDAGSAAGDHGIIFFTSDDTVDRHYKLENAVVSSSYTNDIHIDTVKDIHIDNVCSITAGDVGINLSGYNQRLTNFQVIGDGTDPTNCVSAAASEINIENGYVYYANQKGISVESGTDKTITNIVSEDNVQLGIYVFNIADAYVTIQGCICKGNTVDGIELRNCSFVIVIGCICYDNGANGIELVGAGGGDDCLVLGNICKDNTGTGILEAGGSDYNLIAWNNVRSGNGTAMTVIGTNNSMVRWNIGYNVRALEVWVPVWDDHHAQVSLSNIGDHMSLLMANNQNASVAWNIKIPPDFHSLVAARLVVVPTAADPTLRWSIATDWGLCDEAYNAGSDAVILHNDELTQNDIECLDMSAALTGITAGDHIGFGFWRNGADAADDAGDTHILGFYLQYV